jgi:hypothetical protein
MFSCSELMTENFSELVNDLMNPTIVTKSPMCRFVLNFFFFVTRVVLQGRCLEESYEKLTADGPLIFSLLEFWHASICIGFFMNEINEVKKAHLIGGMSKASYWGSFWNRLVRCARDRYRCPSRN